jgi:hypothetical protein
MRLRRSVLFTAVLSSAVFLSIFSLALAVPGNKLVRLTWEDRDQFELVMSMNLDIAGHSPEGWPDVVVDEDELKHLQAAGIDTKILLDDVDAPVSALRSKDDMGAFHNYLETIAELQSVAAANPSICVLDTIGYTLEGRTILAIKVSDNPSVNEDEAALLYVGVHHAREIISVEIPLYFLDHLVDNYGSDPLITQLVNEREIWILPMLNADGHSVVEGGTDWRKNKRDNNSNGYFDSNDGVDPNRNYGYMWGYDDIGSSPYWSSEVYRGTGPFSEPCTDAVRAFAERENFDTGISFHSHGRWILYPWGYIPQDTPDHDLFSALGESMAVYNGYAPGNAASGLIYITNGDTDDWMYGEQTTKEKSLFFTFEVGTSFYPSESEIPTLCSENLGAMILLARYAENPEELLPPQAPFLYSMGDVDVGIYDVMWSPVDEGTNTAVLFDLEESSGYQVFSEYVVTDSTNWTMDGFVQSNTRKHGGFYSLYSDRDNSLNNYLTLAAPLFPQTGDSLVFWTWFNIEDDYDYGYVQVSTDAGESFVNIPGNITTNYDPNGANRGNGITGSSGGWVRAAFDLSSYAGEAVTYRFAYITDSYVTEEGWYIDDIYPAASFDNTATLLTSSPDTVYHVTQKPVGMYYYRVRGTDTQGHQGNWGPYKTANVLATPVDGTVFGSTYSAMLRENSPNPFNPITSISFVVPGPAGGNPVDANISVFDTRGRLINTLADGKLNPGPNTVTWDGRAESGRSVGSGVYFCVLTVGDERVSRKMVLAK